MSNFHNTIHTNKMSHDANQLEKSMKALQNPFKQPYSILVHNALTELSRSSIKVTTQILIEFQLHTLVRSSEAVAACWKEIDFNKRTWLIPAKRMKSHRDHIVPLSSQAITLLKVLRQINGGSKYLFPSRQDNGKTQSPLIVNVALKSISFKNNTRVMASNALHEQGYDSSLIEEALGHTEHDTNQGDMNSSEQFEKRKNMMSYWSNWIDWNRKSQRVKCL
jgi:integrase